MLDWERKGYSRVRKNICATRLTCNWWKILSCISRSKESIVDMLERRSTGGDLVLLHLIGRFIASNKIDVLVDYSD